MALSVNHLVLELQELSVPELRDKYVEVFGEPARAYHKYHLIRRIAWQVQAKEYGGLSDDARQRAFEIAKDADLRQRKPARTRTYTRLPEASDRTVVRPIDVKQDDRLPAPGALLTRKFKGKTYQVRVLPKGFDYDGTIYRSLSAVAQAISGSHWNGYLFFGLTPPTKGKQE